MDIQKQLEHFAHMSYEDRRTKVLGMLNDLKDAHETFGLAYAQIHALDKVTDNTLLSLYQSILEIAQELRQGKKNRAQDGIKRMEQIWMMIKKQEEKEKEREGNPDELLQYM